MSLNMRQHKSEFKTVLGILHGSRAFGGPLQANLGLTNRCSLKCIHCYFYSAHIDDPNFRPVLNARRQNTESPAHEYLRDLQRQEADTDSFNRLMDELIGMGTRRIGFMGYGEPFLHPNALDFMARAKHAGCACFVNTAGYVFDKEKIDALVEMEFDVLRITTMAGTREMYIRTHRHVKETLFDDIQDNLLYLADRKKRSKGRKPVVELVNVVISENIEGLWDFAEFAIRMKADGVIYRPFDDASDPGLSRLVPTRDQAASAKKTLAEIKTYLDSRNVRHNIDYFLKIWERQLDTSALYRVIPCYFGWAGVQILAAGEVYGCCKCYQILGNIHESSFTEIWHGETYRKFRENAHGINKRGSGIHGCDCHSCTNNVANFRIYKALHPIKSLSKTIRRLTPHAEDKGSDSWRG